MAVTREQVAELYVADFNRAPDAAGLDYWVASGLTIEQISESFFDQAETQAMYPDTMTDSVFVNTIYKNVFNRDADADGLVYWEKELANGSVTRANMILAIINGAQDSETSMDQTILDNKTEVGLYFADAGLEDVDQATDVMADVDATTASVAVAKDEVDTLAPTAANDLTVNRDNIVGTDGDDVIKGLIIDGTADTYQTEDSVKGGAGNDTLKIALSHAATTQAALVSEVETINVALGVTGATLSALSWSDIDNLTVSTIGTYAEFNIENINDEFDSITLSGAEDTNVQTFKTKASTTIFAGSDDSLDVTLTKSSIADKVTTLEVTDSDDVDVIEHFNITSTANNTGTGLTLKSTVLKTVTLSGESTLDLLTTDSTTVTSVDASAMTAAFKYTATGTESTVIGSSVGDTITVGDDLTTTVIGGTGADAITLADGAGTATLKYAYTGDSGLTDAKADSITNFDTDADTIKFVGIDAGSEANFITEDLSTDITIDGSEDDIANIIAAVNGNQLVGKTYFFESSTNILVVDADGDGNADTAIQLDGVVAYTDIIA